MYFFKKVFSLTLQLVKTRDLLAEQNTETIGLLQQNILFFALLPVLLVLGGSVAQKQVKLDLSLSSGLSQLDHVIHLLCELRHFLSNHSWL